MHAVPDENENAAELEFGKDFFTNSDEKCLTIDEVCMFMQENKNATTE